MGNFDLKFYWAVFLRRLPYFLVIAAFLITVAATVAAILPPVYRSSASMLVEPQQIPGELAETTVPINPYEQAQIIEQRLMTRANLLGTRRAGRALRRPARDAGRRDGRRHPRAHRVHRLQPRRDQAAHAGRHHHRRRLRGADRGARQQGRQRAGQPGAAGERAAAHRPGRRHAGVLRGRGRRGWPKRSSASPRRSPTSRPPTSRRCPTAWPPAAPSSCARRSGC